MPVSLWVNHCRITNRDCQQPVPYAGAQGDFAGLDQVNIELPGSLRGRGEVPVIVFTDRVFSSNTVTVTIK